MFFFDFTVCDSLSRATQDSSKKMRSNCQEYDSYDDQTPFPDWNLHFFSYVSWSHQSKRRAEEDERRCLKVVGTVDPKGIEVCEENDVQRLVEGNQFCELS